MTEHLPPTRGVVWPPEVLEHVAAGVPHDMIVLTYEQAAGILGVHVTSIGKIVRRGKLHGFRTGPTDGTPRVTLAALREYIATQQADGGKVVRRLAPNPVQQRRRIRPVPDQGQREPWDAA